MMYRSLIVVLLSLCCGAAWSAEVAIAHAGVAEASLSDKDLKNIFLGKKSAWNDGTRIQLGTLAEGEVHDNFLRDAVGMSSSQFSKFWKKQVFTGKAKMPKQFATEAELIAFVKETEGAIGYVSEAAATAEGIKKLAIE